MARSRGRHIQPWRLTNTFRSPTTARLSKTWRGGCFAIRTTRTRRSPSRAITWLPAQPSGSIPTRCIRSGADFPSAGGHPSGTTARPTQPSYLMEQGRPCPSGPMTRALPLGAWTDKGTHKLDILREAEGQYPICARRFTVSTKVTNGRTLRPPGDSRCQQRSRMDGHSGLHIPPSG